ncbi:MAG TPA: hypothetical protein VLZ89_16660 [Anaerolineales bacterium]|nr:hypothetical protein [Anaerolineales bacterium]
MNVQIDSALKRGRGYWFVDGFIEMAGGGLLSLLGAILLLSGKASVSTFPDWFLSVAGEIVLAKLLGILAAILILWWLKDHFTYPRTGFVRTRRVSGRQVLIILRNAILFLLVPMLGLLSASLIITSGNGVLAAMPEWFPVALGVVWAALYVLGGEWLGLRRFRWLAALMLLTGIAVGLGQSVIGLPAFPLHVQAGTLPQQPVLAIIDRTLINLALLILISGVILISSGLVTFLRYRKANPVPYAEGS